MTLPSTCYNGISVAAYGGQSSVGPTVDNGRAKPDLTAPGSATSYSTPLVSGAAAILLQAALRGDAGSDTNSAADLRTLKTVLLNGAVKPADWANPSPSPLDPRYGAGILNVFASYLQFAGGKQAYLDSGTVASGGAHPPTGATGNISVLGGWDFNTISSSVLDDGVNHYYFNLPASGSATFAGTMTLVWNRQLQQSGINQLYLYLYDAGSGNLVASSVSTVDNVQHIFAAKLPAGRYDLQVLKNGGLGGKSVSSSETYALAFDFVAPPPLLTITPSGHNVVVSWPASSSGYVLESTSNLNPPAAWGMVTQKSMVVNNQNTVTVSSITGNQFFRLVRQ